MRNRNQMLAKKGAQNASTRGINGGKEDGVRTSEPRDPWRKAGSLCALERVEGGGGGRGGGGAVAVVVGTR